MCLLPYRHPEVPLARHDLASVAICSWCSTFAAAAAIASEKYIRLSYFAACCQENPWLITKSAIYESGIAEALRNGLFEHIRCGNMNDKSDQKVMNFLVWGGAHPGKVSFQESGAFPFFGGGNVKEEVAFSKSSFSKLPKPFTVEYRKLRGDMDGPSRREPAILDIATDDRRTVVGEADFCFSAVEVATSLSFTQFLSNERWYLSRAC